MKGTLIAAACAAGALGLTACNYNKDEYNEAANAEAYSDNASGAGYEQTAQSGWPEGARIIEEGGVTYRVDPGGTRVVLAPGDSHIVVEDDVRFRVDPDGTRVRIDPQGAVVSVGPDGVETRLPAADNATVTVNSQ
jgi:hypothetical protein